MKTNTTTRRSFMTAALAAVGARSVVGADDFWWAEMKKAGRLCSPDGDFSIQPIDETGLVSLAELGVDGFGMGEAGDHPIVLIQRLAYNGDFAAHVEFQRQLGAAYAGKTVVCETEASARILRVEIDDWCEGANNLYIYRKVFASGDKLYQVSGQTLMATKDRDRAQLVACVNSFRLRGEE